MVISECDPLPLTAEIENRSYCAVQSDRLNVAVDCGVSSTTKGVWGESPARLSVETASAENSFEKPILPEGVSFEVDKNICLVRISNI